MSLTATLIANIIPLHILIGLGYIAGRRLDVNLNSLARVAIFIISPIVIFGAIAQLDFDARYILLPFLIFGISLTITLPAYALAQKRWRSNMANLIGLGSVSGNTGYFGLPIVLALYGADGAGIYLFMNFATTISENIIGYFLAARGHHTVRESLLKVARLPALYALAAGLLWNASGTPLPDIAVRYWQYATGTWVYVGMMLIGVALSKLKTFELDARLLGWLFTIKFVAWPLLGLSAIAADKAIFHLFPETIYGLVLIMTSVPLMGNLVAFAAQLNLHPEKAALAVLLSTIFAIIYMPALFVLAGHFGIMP
jgi:predicted permease